MLHLFNFLLALRQFLNNSQPTIVASSTNCCMTLSCFFSQTELIFFIFSLAISYSESMKGYVTCRLLAVELCIPCRLSSMRVPQCKTFRFMKLWLTHKEEMILWRDHRRLYGEKSTGLAKSCLGKSRYRLLYLFEGAFFRPLRCWRSAVLFLMIPRNLCFPSNIPIIIQTHQIIKLKWLKEALS